MQIFVVLRKISKEKKVMKQDIQRIMLAAAKPLFLIFILYMLKIVEVGMHWDLSHLGIYPMEKRGVFGILTHPLIHSGFSHLLANTLPLFFLSWCLFYFYRGIAGKIFILIWIGAGLLTFIMAQGGLSVAGRCRCLTKDSNTSIEKEGYIPYSLQA